MIHLAEEGKPQQSLTPMSKTALICILLASPAAAQVPLERTLFERVETNDEVSSGSLIATDWDGPDWGANATSRVAEAIFLEHVDLTSMRVEGEVACTGQLRLRGLDPAGTIAEVRWTYLEYAVDISNFYWGFRDQSTSGNGFNAGSSSGLIQPGEVIEADFFVVAPFSFGRTWTEASHSVWPFILMSPGFHAGAFSRDFRWSSKLANGDPASIEMLSFQGQATAIVEVTAVVELAERPLFTTCTSPANSTGAAGQLRAYGSMVAGEELLTVEATGLPDNQACLLFMGTESIFSPLASYNLCVGGPLTREGGLQFTQQGRAEFHVGLLGRARGDSLYLQVLHRDPSLGVAATSAAAFFVE